MSKQSQTFFKHSCNFCKEEEEEEDKLVFVLFFTLSWNNSVIAKSLTEIEIIIGEAIVIFSAVVVAFDDDRDFYCCCSGSCVFEHMYLNVLLELPQF